MDVVSYGSCVWLLCFHLLPAGDLLQNLKECWKIILSYYNVRKIVERYRGMSKLSMFTNRKVVPSSGRAAQVQHFAAPVQALWAKRMNPAVEIHRKIATLLKVNVAINKLVDENQRSLKFHGPDAAKFQKLGFASAQLRRDLADHFRQERT